MANRRENIFRYINLIVNQLPESFQEYNSLEQEILSDIIKPLQSISKVRYNRGNLAQEFANTRNKIINSKEYLSTPFYWFLDSFFDNAEITLRTSAFHADTFFDYLLQSLKGSDKTFGLFHLLRQGTPFADLKWEKLQYDCSKLRIPLINYQLEIIHFIYKLLETSPDLLLRKGKLKNLLLQSFNRPKLSSELTKFFGLLNAKWNVWPNYQFFGLELFWVKIKISPKNSILDLIDFKDKKNQILTTSWIYSVRGTENEYVGVIFLPSSLESKFRSLLKIKTKMDEIIEYDIYKIISNQWSYSFSQYRSEFGWQEQTESEWNQLVRVLKSEKEPKRKKSINLSYLSPIGEKQDYLDLKEPYEGIRIISNPQIYTYNDLATNIMGTKDLTLLQALIKQNAILVDFFPIRLADEYSLDFYWLKIPKFSFYQLSRFLELLPSVFITYGKNEIFLQARLAKMTAKRIQNDLTWDIYHIIPSHLPFSRQLEMYDQKEGKWKIPHILDF